MSQFSKKPQGSILIWTVVLGVTFMTVFFFFSQRLNLRAALQHKSIEIQNARDFLESYANYLESLTPEALELIPEEEEGITIKLSNGSTEFKGMVDANDSKTFEVKNGQAKIEFNFCGNQEKGRVLELAGVEASTTGHCGNKSYDGLAISEPDSDFTLKTGNAPISYRITPLDQGASLVSDQWKMHLILEIPGQEPLRIEREFIVESE